MIDALHWRNLETIHEMLFKAWQDLKRVRADGDVVEIRNAEMRYFQVLQQVYEAAQDAVALR